MYQAEALGMLRRAPVGGSKPTIHGLLIAGHWHQLVSLHHRFDLWITTQILLSFGDHSNHHNVYSQVSPHTPPKTATRADMTLRIVETLQPGTVYGDLSAIRQILRALQFTVDLGPPGIHSSVSCVSLH